MPPRQRPPAGHWSLALEPQQSRGEEIANSLSHGLGLLAALAAAPLLVLRASLRGDAVAVLGASVFAATLLALYAISTLYHALPPGPAKSRCRRLDHQAIFLLIAGTYTPFTLGVLRGSWGYLLLGLVWPLAAGGVILKAVARVHRPWLSAGMYLGLGWLVLIAIRPLWLAMPTAGLVWLLLGGLAYTAGLGFFAACAMPYSHLVWHLFVLAGSACHFMAVLWYAV